MSKKRKITTSVIPPEAMSHLEEDARRQFIADRLITSLIAEIQEKEKEEDE